MTEKIKNYLGVAIIISILILAISAWSYVNSYSKVIEPGSFRSFSVSGEGKVVAVPDVAEFDFSVITEGGKNIATLQKENTEKMNKAIAFIKSKGVDAKDIKTQNYSLTPRYQYFDCSKVGGVCPPPKIVGYTVTQNVDVKVRDFAKLGDLLSGVVESGANSVSGLSFTVDDSTKIESEARAKAITEAKEKARSVAEAGGFRLGRLISIEESGQPPIIPFYKYAPLPYGAGGDVASPEIEPGSQDVVVNVMMRFEIQ